jgi:hypothetical protein
MAKQQIYGTAIPSPPNAIILRQHWTYLIKKDGCCKARQCFLCFKTATHECSLYTAAIHGFQVLQCRQVDNLAIACTNADTAQWVISQIGAKVDVTKGGLLTTFNGVNIDQTVDYIKISCTLYFRHFLKAHQWDTPLSNKSDNSFLDPLPETLTQAINADTSPTAGSPEAAVLKH